MRVSEIGIIDLSGKQSLPLAKVRIPCGTGFPSPADDYLEERLDLNKHLIKHPAATYYARAEGDSMIGAGIYPGDILIVDKAIEAVNNKIIVAWLNNEFTVKRYYIDDRLGKVYLVPENPKYYPHEITPEMDFLIWGVVTYNIHKL
jgi:DNA polymerase V